MVQQEEDKMAEQSVAREIGQIYAQMIDYRKANKDKIEDYIIKTSLYALDPRVRAERAKILAELERTRKNLDDRLQAIEEGNIENVGKIREEWVASSGGVAKQELSSISDIAKQDISGKYGLAEKKVAAASALNVAKQKGTEDRKTKVLEANLGIVDSLEKETNEGLSGEGSRIDGALKIAAGQGLTQGGTLDVATLTSVAQEVWDKEYKAKYLALANNPMGQKAVQQGYQNAITEIIATSDANTPAGVPGLGTQLGSKGYGDLIVSASGGDISREQYGKGFQTTAEEQVYLRTQDPDIRAAALQSVSGIGAGVSFDRYVGALKAAEIEGAPIYRQLGLDSEAQVPEFYNRVAYNRYLLAAKKTDPEAEVVDYTDFKANLGKGGVEDRLVEYTKSAPVEDNLNFGNRSYIDIQLERLGVGRDIAAEKAIEAKAQETILTPGKLAVETQTEYYRQYGGPGQRRLVDIKDFAERTPITYTNPDTGKEEQVYLGTPEMEFLLGDRAKVKRTPPPIVETPPPPPPPPEPKPKAEEQTPPTKPIEFDEEPPIDLSGGADRPTGARMDRTIGYGTDEIELKRGRTTKPVPDQTGDISDDEFDDILDMLPEEPDKAEETGQKLSKRAQQLQAELQLASTPEEQTRVQDALARVSQQAKRLVVADKSNPLTDEDFANATSEDALIAKINQSKKPPPQSAAQIKGREAFVIEAQGKVAASKALEEKSKTGKEAKPEKFVKSITPVPDKAVAFLKDLATKKGRISAEELNKAVVALLGEDASQKQIDAAKSIYVAYETIA
jgi:hypothetical protein